MDDVLGMDTRYITSPTERRIRSYVKASAQKKRCFLQGAQQTLNVIIIPKCSWLGSGFWAHLAAVLGQVTCIYAL
jgi:hypothetical protein